MRIACESFVKDILPAVRALVARDLLQKHDLTQKEAARRLEMTQPAISQYKNRLRGRKVKKLEASKPISNLIGKLVRGIASQQIEREELDSKFCEICEEARAESLLPEGASCESV